MAISVLQAAHAINSTSSLLDITANFASNVTAGNAIIAFVSWGYGSATHTPANGDLSDVAGDTFTVLSNAVNDVTNGQRTVMYVTYGSAGGHTDVKLKASTFGGNEGQFSTLIVIEVSGLASNGHEVGASHLVAAGGGSSATNGDTTSSFTTTTDGDLIVAGFCDEANGTAVWSAGTSPQTFTIPTNASIASGGAGPTALEYAVQSTHGAINPAMTSTATNGYAAIGWSFKPSSTTPSSSDSATVTDTANQIGVGGQSDTNSETETNKIGLGNTDAATLAEQVAIALGSSDSATLAESIKIALGATESAQLGEAMAIALAHQDSATLQELVSVALAIVDAASLTESASVTQNGGNTPSASDSASLADTASNTAHTSASDIGALAEQAAITLKVTDVAAMTEQIGLGLIAADSAALNQQLAIAVANAATDSAALAEVQTAVSAALAAAEAVHLGESATVQVFSGGARDWVYVISAPSGKWTSQAPTGKWSAAAPQQ